MRGMTLVTTATIALASVGVHPLAAQSATSDVAAVRALDSLFAHNYAVNDTASAIRLMAPDFFMTAGNGRTKDKAAELGDIRPTPGLKMLYARTESPNINVYGSTAIVSGFLGWSFEQNGRTATYRRKYVAVYVRGGPLGWQLQELHMSPS